MLIEIQTHLKDQGFMVFKMENFIDHSMKNVIQMGPNFISLESVKNITCVDLKNHI